MANLKEVFDTWEWIVAKDRVRARWQAEIDMLLRNLHELDHALLVTSEKIGAKDAEIDMLRKELEALQRPQRLH